MEPLLRCCASPASTFALLAVALPLFTPGLLMPQTGGVFSFASFAMRISLTWPDAWRWILNHEVFPFGVGLGGIGGAQRFYAANFFNPSDNLFVYLYANFGVFGLVYLGWVAIARIAPAAGVRAPGDRATGGAGLQPRLWRRSVDAGGSDVGAVHRRGRRHAVAAASDGARGTAGAIRTGGARMRLRAVDAAWLRRRQWSRDEGAMTNRLDETQNNFTLLRLLLALMVVLGHFKLLSGTD